MYFVFSLSGIVGVLKIPPLTHRLGLLLYIH